ncbi:DUF4156 domain-containing protein [Shewanella pealeana]|uniref:Outer membrane lipoprotein n=1 Tax=Shewanella pealeana (strain ATCC 700345 / ANG-SQ1) TaxID=398579 RepID=A8H6D8_SHEPA|nr:DUF4156 domain-containing protein [Shewanella pealeana]ABV88125.1 conserved hypothetical protein [Shewanella pealeana ATCC 700345]
MKFVKLAAIALMCSSLSACITFPTDESNTVKVLWDDTDSLVGCEHKGTVIGSQGHFYDYWLHADKDMVWGTLNEMRIKAAKLGADTIYLYKPLGFTGSVTMIANAYDCETAPLETNSSSQLKINEAADVIMSANEAQ